MSGQNSNRNGIRCTLKRPLQPPESRRRVKRQAQHANNVIVIDSDEEVITSADLDRPWERTAPASHSGHNVLPEVSGMPSGLDSRYITPIAHQATPVPRLIDINTDPFQGLPHPSTSGQGTRAEPGIIRHPNTFQFSGKRYLEYTIDRLHLCTTITAQVLPLPLANNCQGQDAECDRLERQEKEAVSFLRSVRDEQSRTIDEGLDARCLPNNRQPNLVHCSEQIVTEASHDHGTKETHSVQEKPHKQHRDFSRIQTQPKMRDIHTDESNVPQSQDGDNYEPRPHPHSKRGLREQPSQRFSRPVASNLKNRRPLTAATAPKALATNDKTLNHTSKPTSTKAKARSQTSTRGIGLGTAQTARGYRQGSEPIPRFYAPIDADDSPLPSTDSDVKDLLPIVRNIMRTNEQAEEVQSSHGSNIQHVPDTEVLLPEYTNDKDNDANNNDPSVFDQLASDSLLPLTQVDNSADGSSQVFRPRGDLSELGLREDILNSSPKRRETIINHEIAKSTQRDLLVLKDVIIETARNAAMGDIRQTELQEIQQYIFAVLDQNLSGKQQRYRMRAIKENVRNRRTSSKVSGKDPSKAELDNAVRAILATHHFEQLQREIKELAITVKELSAQRRSMGKSRKHRNRKRPSLKWTKEPFREASKSRSVSEEEGGAEFLSFVENQRLPATSPAAHSENCETYFTAHSGHNEQTATPLIVDGNLPELQPVDKGEHCPKSPLENAQSKLLEENLRRRRKYENEKLEKANCLRSQSREVVDEDLDFSDSDDSETDFDVSKERDKDGREIVRYPVKACFRGFKSRTSDETYLIGYFRKLSKADKRLDQVIDDAKQTYCSELGRKEKIVSSLHQSYDNDDDGDDNSRSDGLRRLKLTLGRVGEAECSAWIEEEIYSLSEEAYRSAKGRAICRKSPLWHVVWQKVLFYREIIPTIDQPNHATDSYASNDCDQTMTDASKDNHSVSETAGYETTNSKPALDDKYPCIDRTATDVSVIKVSDQLDGIHDDNGDDNHVINKDKEVDANTPEETDDSVTTHNPCTSSTSLSVQVRRCQHPATQHTSLLSSVTACIPPEEFKAYTTIALANRAALTKYFDWWYSTLSSNLRGDHAWIRSEEGFLEDDLKRHGDRFLWASKEQEAVIGEQEISGRRHEKIEKFWIAVRELDIYGPANTGYGE